MTKRFCSLKDAASEKHGPAHRIESNGTEPGTRPEPLKKQPFLLVTRPRLHTSIYLPARLQLKRNLYNFSTIEDSYQHSGFNLAPVANKRRFSFTSDQVHSLLTRKEC